MHPTVCPQCGGTLVGCTECGYPPKRKKPFDRRVARADILNIAYVTYPVITSARWAVEGIDISSWNGTMRFEITKTKAQFAFVRLGYGSKYKDNRADANRAGLLAADIPYGGYWYCRPGIDDPNLSAESFAAVAAEYPYQLDLVIDAEQTGLDDAATHAWLVTFDTRLNQLTGRRLRGLLNMPYSSAGFWDTHMPPTNYWDNHPKFVANWTEGNSPWLPASWTVWRFWQYSADGNRKGLEYGSSSDGDADMDLDRFHGTVEQFNSLYGTHILPIGIIPPPPPPPPIGLPVFDVAAYPKVQVTTASLRLRTLPSLAGKVIAILPNGTIMTSVGLVGDWAAVVYYCHKDYLKIIG